MNLYHFCKFKGLITLLNTLGTLDAPHNFNVTGSNTSYTLSWGAPFSLNVTDYSPDVFNYTLCTSIKCMTMPSSLDCTYPRTCNSTVQLSNSSINGSNGRQNSTIMLLDDSGPIMFTFFAINGAGNGRSASFNFTRVPGLYIFVVIAAKKNLTYIIKIFRKVHVYMCN